MLIRKTSKEYSPVEEALYTKERSRLLKEAIDALPPKRREIFQLVKIEERSYEEVSLLLHISTSTINDHVVKATKFIKKNLERHHITTITILFLQFIF